MLSERIRVACKACKGTGRTYNKPGYHISGTDCSDCAGTGHDLDAERRLGELVGRLPDAVAGLGVLARDNERQRPGIVGIILDLDALTAMLLGTEGER